MLDVVERTPKPTPGAVLSIDVEDGFHVHNLKAVVARDTWDERELRVERNTDRMLELMADRGVRCTCFVLGWVAEKCPGLVTRIADRSLPFGGTWTYVLAPDGNGTRLTITEHGEVYNPIFRFVSRFIIGHTGTMEGVLRALGTKHGETVTPEAVE